MNDMWCQIFRCQIKEAMAKNLMQPKLNVKGDTCELCLSKSFTNSYCTICTVLILFDSPNKPLNKLT